MNYGRVFCVSGIDTDIGKTIATGLIARGLLEAGVNVITQKVVQTGCEGLSEDIQKHRDLMGIGVCDDDRRLLTCSYIYKTPCSPHLAANIEHDSIDPEVIREATGKLQEKYEVVLLEGAGGLFVPLMPDFTQIDYFESIGAPVILVTSSRLGSLNHTFASLEALKSRKIDLAGIVYNRFGSDEQHIADDSLKMITLYMRKYGYNSPVVEMYGEEMYREPGSCLPFTVVCSDYKRIQE